MKNKLGKCILIVSGFFAVYGLIGLWGVFFFLRVFIWMLGGEWLSIGDIFFS